MKNNTNTKAVLLLFFFSAFSFLSFSQNKNFRKWSVNDGLPSSVIYNITQDERGYIWTVTENGACRFDGTNFKTFTKKEGLVGNQVRCVFEDSYQNLWFGTNEGISVYDGTKFSSITKKNGLSGATVLCFIEDEKKNIWAGTDDGGLNIISKINKDSFNIKTITTKEGLSSNAVFDLYLDKDNDVWVATLGGGISILSPSTNSYKIKIISGKENIPSDMLLSISVDADSSIWFGTYDAGAFKTTSESKKNEKFWHLDLNTTNGLNSNSVWDILNTKNQNLWIGSTDNGITRFFQTNFDSPNKSAIYKTEQGISGNQIYSLFEDREGNIWIGTNGDGLSILTGDEFSHYNKQDGLPENKIQAVEQDKNGSIWIATSGGGLANLTFKGTEPFVKIFSDKEKKEANFISCISTGNLFNPNLWIGTASNGIIKYDGKKFYSITEKDGLKDNRVSAILVNAKGIVWVGTANGISRYDGVNFEVVSTQAMKMANEGVRSIIEDKEGNIWFGTAGGLARYNENKTLRTFDEVEGLTNINVNAICEDASGNIFIGTNGGGIFKYTKSKPDSISISFVADEKILGSNSIHSLIFIDSKTLVAGTNKGFEKIYFETNQNIISVKSYNSTDGFAGIECNDNALCKDNAGNVWFGTVNGLTKYSPSLERKYNLPPSLQITSIQLFYKDVDWAIKADSICKWNNLPKHLVLSYSENNLTFNFAGISFSNPEKIKYKYILEGRDKDWSPLSFVGNVTFSGITKGTYTFKVIAVNANGIESTAETFEFIITPPWWETNLFYFIVLGSIVICIYFFIKWREKKLVTEKEILENTVAERTHELAEKNKEITDSINYARRLQSAILPNINEISKSLPQSFILFQPKDIVSGDFYWYFKSQELIYIACADCTGHGVPGAFMSTIGVEKLNDAIKQFAKPGEILSFVNRAVKKSLSQSQEAGSEDTSAKDGMDIALLCIDFTVDGANVQYSGAHRPMWILRNSALEIEEVKATKAAIGGYTNDNQPFETHTFTFTKGDTIYMFSDGYADQFGMNNKKLMTKNFKNKLIEIQNHSLAVQQIELENFVNNWKGNTPQTDDILVIGIKI